MKASRNVVNRVWSWQQDGDDETEDEATGHTDAVMCTLGLVASLNFA